MHRPLKGFLLVVIIAAIAPCLTPKLTAQSSIRSDPKAERVVIAVSPDGGLLAIARSSYDDTARNGRVELWDLKIGQFRKTITGFDGSISYVSFARDGQSFVTRSTEYRQSKIQSKPQERSDEIVTELKWWNTQTGEFIRKTTLTGQPGVRSGPAPNESLNELFMRKMLSTPGTLQAVLSPDGNTIAVVKSYIEQGINLVGEGRNEEWIRRPRGSSPVIVSFDIELFELTTGKRKSKMSGQSTSMKGEVQYGPLVFSPDGRFFAVGAAREVKVWDTTTGKKLQTIDKFDGRPAAMTFSPDSRSIAISSTEFSRIAAGTAESQISVWEVSTNKLIRDLRTKDDYVGVLTFAPAGNALLLGTTQYEAERRVGTVKVWDLASNRLEAFNVHQDQIVSSLHILPGNRELLIQTGLNVEIRDVRTWRVTQAFEVNSEEPAPRSAHRFLLSVKHVDAIAFSSDGTTLSGVISEEGLHIWDFRTGGRKPHQIKTTNGLIARSANGKVLGELTPQEVKLWDLLTGTSRTLPHASTTPASAFTMSSDGGLLAIAEGPNVHLRNSTDEQSSRTLKGHQSAVQRLAFSMDHRTLASADESGTIKIWDLGSGQIKQSFSSESIVTSLAIDASGQFVASAGSDYVVSVWNVGTGVPQLKLKKHDNIVNALAFSPDGKTLASGGDDRMAVVWNLSDGKPLQILKGHDLTVMSLAFSPDLQLLAAGSGNASVVLWNVNSGKLDRVLH